MRFVITQVRPPGFVHALALSELAELIGYGLLDLGHEVRFLTGRFDPAVTNIVIGPHRLSTEVLPPDTILINTEPLLDGIGPWDARIEAFARRHEVWDYSDASAAWLRARTGGNIKRLRVGWHPRLRRVPKLPEQDIDVLFYGSSAGRRGPILDAFAAADLNFVSLFGVYGSARDAHIARAKVVLNLHGDGITAFETVRVSYLMTNAKAVVAEVGPDTEIEPAYATGVAGVPVERLLDTCRHYLADDAARAALEAGALAAIQTLPQAELLAPLLAGR